MKSTDIARKDRDLRRARKKEEVLARKTTKAARSVGDYINELTGLFFHDGSRIYNINSSEEILTLLEEMREELPEKQWNNVLKKSIKKSKVSEKDVALEELRSMGEIAPD